jgi:hypothetical protein
MLRSYIGEDGLVGLLAGLKRSSRADLLRETTP